MLQWKQGISLPPKHYKLSHSKRKIANPFSQKNTLHHPHSNYLASDHELNSQADKLQEFLTSLALFVKARLQKNWEEERFLKETLEHNPCLRHPSQGEASVLAAKHWTIVGTWVTTRLPSLSLLQRPLPVPGHLLHWFHLSVLTLLSRPSLNIISRFFQPRQIAPSSDLSLQSLTLIWL